MALRGHNGPGQPFEDHSLGTTVGFHVLIPLVPTLCFLWIVGIGGRSKCRGCLLLTFIMASFTRSSLIRPSLNRFSTSSELVEPEQYHAIEPALLVVGFNVNFDQMCLFIMQSTYTLSVNL